MKAIDVQVGDDGPELQWKEVEDVFIQPDEVLVDVHATAVNRADLAQARGTYPPPMGESEILGLEMAGVVASTGKAVTKWKPGDAVFSLLAGGGYAEQVAVHQDLVLPVPENWNFHRAAAIPEAWLTAYVNLFLEGDLKAGETALVHAGASGVGTAAIQLAKSANATVIITTSSNRKVEVCSELGADLSLSYKDSDFFSQIMTWTDESGVDLILDPVGGAYLEGNIRSLRQFGRLISIGLLGGNKSTLDLGLVLAKRLKIVGSRLRNRPLDEKIEISHSFWNRFGPLFIADAIRPVIDIVFPIEDAQSAHEYVRQNRNIGKVLLAVRD
jgi:tumor protein p53-inducible protein 3